MISQIQLSCEKIMLPLVQNTAVKFYIKGVQSKHRFDVSVPFSICYVGPLLNVLLSIDKDFYGSELSEYIRSKVLFSKNSIKFLRIVLSEYFPRLLRLVMMTITLTMHI